MTTAPRFWDMLSIIYEAAPETHVMIKEWGQTDTIWEGLIKDVPCIPFYGREYTVANIMARIEEDMSEIQYYTIEIVELRKAS